MDFVPFTIFFTACLMVIHENQASPFGCRKAREWPKRCVGKAYCFDMPTDYPSTPELKEMFHNSGFDISKLKTPKPTDRSSSGPCRHYHMVDPIYMIKDAKNAVRYVVQDPNLVNQTVPILPCKKQVDLNPSLTCEEDLGPWPFLVMTCDGKGVEILKHKIPSGCSVRQVKDYDYD